MPGPILVTGAAGFIGMHLVHALLARGERVVGLDNFNDHYDDPRLNDVYNHGQMQRDFTYIDDAVAAMLDRPAPAVGSEIQLTDAIARCVGSSSVIARRFTGTRYDCGSKAGWLQANEAMGHKAGFL